MLQKFQILVLSSEKREKTGGSVREYNRWGATRTDDIQKSPTKAAGRKRSSEGNKANTNSFSCLDSEEIIARANGMGAKFDPNDFDSVNLLSELEKARFLLSKKPNIQNDTHTAGEIQEQNDKVELHTECVEEENTDYDDFTLVTPKRIRKPNRKFLFSASNKKHSKSTKEIPCNKIGTVHQGNSGVSRGVPKRKKRKTNHERTNMELQRHQKKVSILSLEI